MLAPYAGVAAELLVCGLRMAQQSALLAARLVVHLAVPLAVAPQSCSGSRQADAYPALHAGHCMLVMHVACHIHACVMHTQAVLAVAARASEAAAQQASRLPPTRRSTSWLLSSSCPGVRSAPSGGMQYWQRRLQRSVRLMRR